MLRVITNSVQETEAFAEKFGRTLKGGMVVAFFGGLGMGKTAFTRGLVRARGIDAEVSSPTFALVHEYGGNPPVCHFDMYRVKSWEDLYATGFFDYIDAGAILAVEWSENIENALPEDSVRIEIERGETENQRIITVKGDENYENFSL